MSSVTHQAGGAEQSLSPFCHLVYISCFELGMTLACVCDSSIACLHLLFLLKISKNFRNQIITFRFQQIALSEIISHLCRIHILTLFCLIFLWQIVWRYNWIAIHSHLYSRPPASPTPTYNFEIFTLGSSVPRSVNITSNVISRLSESRSGQVVGLLSAFHLE